MKNKIAFEICRHYSNKFMIDPKTEIVIIDNGENLFSYTSFDAFFIEWFDTLIESALDGENWAFEIAYIYKNILQNGRN